MLPESDIINQGQEAPELPKPDLFQGTLVTERRDTIANEVSSLLPKRSAYHSDNGNDFAWLDILSDYLNPNRYREERKVYLNWQDDATYQRKLKRHVNEPDDREWAEVREMVKNYFVLADALIDRFIGDVFNGECRDLRELFGVHPLMRRTNDLRDLYGLIYERRTDICDAMGLTRDVATRMRFEAHRKIALGMLMRSLTQEPEFKTRKADSDFFEKKLLPRVLILPGSTYNRVSVWFRLNSTTSQVEWRLDDPNDRSWEQTELLALRFRGEISRSSNEERELTVYCFPGDKNQQDAELPGLSVTERSHLSGTPSIIHYKNLASAGLKRFRKMEILDKLRCTLLVADHADLPLLNAMLDTCLGSTIKRETFRYGNGNGNGNGNGASSLAYPDDVVKVVEQINNAEEGRNFPIEIRSGTFQLLCDRSKNGASASHNMYRARRSIPVTFELFPKHQEQYRPLHEAVLTQAMRLFTSPDQQRELREAGLDANFLREMRMVRAK